MTEIYCISVIALHESFWITSTPWEFLIAIWDHYTKSNVIERLKILGWNLSKELYSSSIISNRCQHSQGSVLLARSVINPEAHVGSNVILNTVSTVDYN